MFSITGGTTGIIPEAMLRPGVGGDRERLMRGLAVLLLFTLLSCCSAQTVPAAPGTVLLSAVKAVADSNQIDDPDAVGKIMHLSFTLSGSTLKALPYCAKNGGRFENDYAVEGTSWFRTQSPDTGNLLLSTESGPTVAESNTAGKIARFVREPEMDYKIFPISGCPPATWVPLSWPLASINMLNIPSYSCIDVADIKAVFDIKQGIAESFYYSNVIHPYPGATFAERPDRTIAFGPGAASVGRPGPDFFYELSFPIPSPHPGIDATRVIDVNFWMTEQADRLNAQYQPECLLKLVIESHNHLAFADF